jgi:hypothetical protein
MYSIGINQEDYNSYGECIDYDSAYGSSNELENVKKYNVSIENVEEEYNYKHINDNIDLYNYYYPKINIYNIKIVDKEYKNSCGKLYYGKISIFNFGTFKRCINKCIYPSHMYGFCIKCLYTSENIISDNLTKNNKIIDNNINLCNSYIMKYDKNDKEYISHNLKAGNKIICDNGVIYIENKINKNIIERKKISNKIYCYKKYNIEDYRYCITCDINIFSEYNLCFECYADKKVFDMLIGKVKGMKSIFYKDNIYKYNMLLKGYIKRKIGFECINFKSQEYKILNQ